MNLIKLSLLAIIIFISTGAKSQVSVNVNIGSPPLWGPVGYTEVRYYYLPDVEAYYDVHSSMFIYFGDGVWIHRNHLPSRFHNYDLYGGYKVVMSDYHGNAPYTHFKHHKSKYYKGYRGGSQKTIGNKPGKSYSNKNTNNGGQKNAGKKQNSNTDMKKNNNVQYGGGDGGKHGGGSGNKGGGGSNKGGGGGKKK